ncbi:MAG: MarR family winged helix-turn-helix transcriptional regulator [Gammaproteobacteria bacterium]|nr:MarR family winged helix-turn-helix transcriptional regulator [Gammaproteobacteria bacterium]
MDDFKLGMSLSEVLKLFHSVVDNKIGLKGYSKTDFYIIMYLSNNNGSDVTQKDLCEFTFTKAPTISIALSKLENMGIVIRTKSDKDNRKMVVKLTDKGDEVFVNIKDIIRNENKNALSVLTEDERAIFFNSLDKIKTHLEVDNA